MLNQTRTKKQTCTTALRHTIYFFSLTHCKLLSTKASSLIYMVYLVLSQNTLCRKFQTVKIIIQKDSAVYCHIIPRFPLLLPSLIFKSNHSNAPSWVWWQQSWGYELVKKWLFRNYTHKKKLYFTFLMISISQKIRATVVKKLLF